MLAEAQLVAPQCLGRHEGKMAGKKFDAAGGGGALIGIDRDQARGNSVSGMVCRARLDMCNVSNDEVKCFRIEIPCEK